MSGVPEHGAPHYGNLLSYKYYMRPTAQRMYGSSWRTEAKHHKNIQRLLEILALNGTCTTWDMAKLDLPEEGVRGREKEIRRLLTGRTDRGKRSSGALELGLITVDGGGSGSDSSPNRYRLSLHGILYCLDTLMLNENDMDKIASRYASALPRLFGRWDQLRWTSMGRRRPALICRCLGAQSNMGVQDSQPSATARASCANLPPSTAVRNVLYRFTTPGTGARQPPERQSTRLG